MAKKGREISIPIDQSLGEVYYQAEQLLKTPGYRDSSRLTLLGGVIRHHTVIPTLENASYQPWKFDLVITRMKNPRLLVGKRDEENLAYPRRGNGDVLMQAYDEAKSRGKDMVYPVDLMIGLLRLQPPPVDRVVTALEIDRMALIEALKEGN